MTLAGFIRSDKHGTSVLEKRAEEFRKILDSARDALIKLESPSPEELGGPLDPECVELAALAHCIAWFTACHTDEWPRMKEGDITVDAVLACENEPAKIALKCVVKFGYDDWCYGEPEEHRTKWIRALVRKWIETNTDFWRN